MEKNQQRALTLLIRDTDQFAIVVHTDFIESYTLSFLYTFMNDTVRCCCLYYYHLQWGGRPFKSFASWPCTSLSYRASICTQRFQSHSQVVNPPLPRPNESPHHIPSFRSFPTSRWILDQNKRWRLPRSLQKAAAHQNPLKGIGTKVFHYRNHWSFADCVLNHFTDCLCHWRNHWLYLLLLVEF